jgi:tetratricopeptide (TPR) repeat protein
LAKWNRAIDDFDKALALEPTDAGLLHELARLLAHCPDQKVRNPRRAVELARGAVSLNPRNGDYRGALGSAFYRAGDWKAAIEALTKSQELSNSSRAHDWFFLAMAEWQLGNKDDARRWYDKADKWINENQKALQDAPGNAEELKRFRTEASELLGIKEK